MTWKQFVRRFNEIMEDTSCTPLGVTDLEAWQREQKEITQRTLRETQEQADLLEHWYEQDAYVHMAVTSGSWCGGQRQRCGDSGSGLI